MNLFLASEAKHPDSMEKLKQHVGGFACKRIVFIPTAANGDFYGSWKAGGSLKTVHSLGAQVDIIELESNYYQNVIEKIGKPDILWFMGGMSGYLLYWIRRVQLDKALSDILSGHTVYVGSSAGSMVCSKTQSLNEWYLGEAEPGAQLIPGLGLIDFEIYPHYEESLLPEIKKLWARGKLYLIKNGEAIIVKDGKVTVLGKERIVEK